MKERSEHLSAVESMTSANSAEFSRWADTRLDRWLVDWALRNRKEQTARQIAQERGIETLVDIDLFSDIRRIEDALARQSSSEALAWCSENKAALRKVKVRRTVACITLLFNDARRVRTHSNSTCAYKNSLNWLGHDNSWRQ